MGKGNNNGKTIWFKTKYGQLCLALIIAGLSFLVFSHIALIGTYVGRIFSFFSPVLTAFIVAYALDPFCTLYEEKLFGKMKNSIAARGAAVIMTVIIALAALVLLMVGLIPQLVESVKTLTGNARRYVYLISLQLDRLDGVAKEYDLDLSQFSGTVEDALGNAISTLSGSSGAILNTGVSIGAGVYNIVIIFIISIYVLADKKRILSGFKRLMRLIFPEKIYHSSGVFWKHCNRILIRFIVFDLLDGLIVGFANYLFMMIMRMPYSILISIVVGITNLAPTFGPVVGGVIGGIILFFVNPWWALWFIIFTVVLQTFDGYMIKPKLFGDSLGVPALVILISIILCGNLMGVWGVLLGIPIAAILDYIYHDYVLVRLEKRREERENAARAAVGEPVLAAAEGEIPDSSPTEDKSLPVSADAVDDDKTTAPENGALTDTDNKDSGPDCISGSAQSDEEIL